MKALDVLGVVEELVRKPERIDDAHRVADALREAVRVAAHVAAELLVERDGPVEVFRRAHAVREGGDGGDGGDGGHTQLGRGKNFAGHSGLQ